MTWTPAPPELNGMVGWVFATTDWRHRGRLYTVYGVLKGGRFRVQFLQPVRYLCGHGPADMDHAHWYYDGHLRSAALLGRLCVAAAAELEGTAFVRKDLQLDWPWDLAQIGHQARFWTPPAEPPKGQLALSL